MSIISTQVKVFANRQLRILNLRRNETKRKKEQEIQRRRTLNANQESQSDLLNHSKPPTKTTNKFMLFNKSISENTGRRYSRSFKGILFCALFIICLIIIPAICFYAVEYIYLENEKWTFLTCIYFVMITLTTVGFGDYVPTVQIRNSRNDFLSTIYVIVIFSWIFAGLIITNISLGLISDSIRFISKRSNRRLKRTVYEQTMRLKNRHKTWVRDGQIWNEVKNRSCDHFTEQEFPSSTNESSSNANNQNVEEEKTPKPIIKSPCSDYRPSNITLANRLSNQSRKSSASDTNLVLFSDN